MTVLSTFTTSVNNSTLSSKVKYQFFEINYVNEIKQLYCSLAMMEGY